jgi:hypothetical protein
MLRELRAMRWHWSAMPAVQDIGCVCGGGDLTGQVLSEAFRWQNIQFGMKTSENLFLFLYREVDTEISGKLTEFRRKFCIQKCIRDAVLERCTGFLSI